MTVPDSDSGREMEIAVTALRAIVAFHDRIASETEPGFTCGCQNVCGVAKDALRALGEKP